jgi:hypothetical protein
MFINLSFSITLNAEFEIVRNIRNIVLKRCKSVEVLKRISYYCNEAVKLKYKKL